MQNPRQQKIAALAALVKGDTNPFKMLTEQIVIIESTASIRLEKEQRNKIISDAKARSNEPVIIIEL